MSRSRLATLWSAFLFSFAASDLWIHAAESYPRRPIRIIVPFAAGGGSDTFVRLITRGIAEANLSPQPLAVLNVPGAGGTIGSRRARYAPADGYTVLNLHDGIITAKYAGSAHYGPEAFEPVIATGEVDMVIAVKAGQRYEDLGVLMQDVETAPNTVRFAANLGAPSHFAGLLLEARSGAGAGRFRFVQFGGGAKRFGALLGGHADVSVFSVAEFLAFRDGGLKALSVVSRTRSSALPEVPTAQELGVDFVFTNTQFWWLPRGVSPERRQFLEGLLASAMTVDSVKEALATMHVKPIVLTGSDLQAAIAEKEAAISRLEIRRPLAVPAFVPGLLVLFVGLLSVFSWRKLFGARAASKQRVVTEQGVSFGGTLARWAMVFLYVGLLSLRWIPFAWLTFCFVVILGGSLRCRSIGQMASLVVSAAVFALGLSWVFGTWLQIDLP